MIRNEKKTGLFIPEIRTKKDRNAHPGYGYASRYRNDHAIRRVGTQSHKNLYRAVKDAFKGGEVAGTFIIYSFID
jgi:hypothetical protein